MNRDLFYEIGTEEIPARYINNALKEIYDLLSKNLNALNIEFESIEVKTTPRRFAIVVRNIAEKQKDLKEEFKGPSKKIAYDADGNPTKALLGFVKGKGGNIENVEIRTSGEDEYIYLTVEKKGEETVKYVKDVLENVIRNMNFPKPMRWGGKNLKFIRPIRWLICVFHGNHIDFDIEGINTTKITKGHRFLGTQEIEISDFEDYKQKLKDNFVILDQDERRAMILEQVKKVAEELEGNAIIDEDILEEVNFIVEYPTAFYGSYSEEYLKLPEEVIITPMEAHQRYFPVRGKDGKLVNYFITVRNGDNYMIENVRKGNEKVLVARLMDAKFFYGEDTKKSLESFVSGLDTIVFQQKLGTMRDKVNRIDKSAHCIAEMLGMDTTHISRAALLAKADLTTAMVFEFTELQGIMGRYYAQLTNEPKPVCDAIFEHYLPRNASDELPKTNEGILLSLADKMDSIAGFFSIGIQPTGSQDPYALRRQAIAVINILMSKDYNINLKRLFKIALSQFETENIDTVEAELMEFFKLRINSLLLDMGIRYDVVNAVLENENASLYEILAIAKDTEKWLQDDKAEVLSTVLRAHNLLKEEDFIQIDKDLFVDDSEKALYDAYLSVRDKFESAIKNKAYIEALNDYEEICPHINNLFDNVMIMDKDENIKNNRLSLLNSVVKLVAELLDITKLNYK